MNTIYFMTDGADIKIGKSGNTNRRLKELQTGNAKSLKVIGVIDTHINESSYQHDVTHWRCEGGGTEWFRGEKPVIKYVAMCLNMPLNHVKTLMKKPGQKTG